MLKSLRHLHSKLSSPKPLKNQKFYSTNASTTKPLLSSAKLSTLGSHVELKFGTQKFVFDSFWLRDNCPSTVHPKTYQRLSPTASIPLNIKPEKVELKEDNLFIQWPDRHQSIYSSSWLWNHLHREIEDISPPNSHNSVLWSGRTWTSTEAIPVRVSYSDLILSSDGAKKRATLKALLQNLYKYGFALVDNAPATPEATRTIGEQIGVLRMTIFGGDLWDYVIESHKESLLHSDTAYTPMDIKPHTDGTYHHDPAGIQIFHCLEHQGTGGVNGLVDGWNVITKLQESNPDVYKFLTTSPIDFYYSDPNFSFHSVSPVVQLNSSGAISAFKFNNHDRNPPHPLRTDLPLYHKSVQLLEQSIESKDNRVDIKLVPGLVLLTYGWRVLHARTPFTGRRRMAGCYVGADDFLSKYRVLSRNSATNIQLH